ncbi:MAG: glycosyltransferase family 2 protein, partial [Candidatus Moranbacteria bacterium CG_4_10_14_3_um_filter_45_9]
MNTDPRISLIFVNYQSVRYLREALESLFSFETEKDFFEVIIVNNDSTERFALEGLKQAFPLLLIENSKNVGFGCGNNIG